MAVGLFLALSGAAEGRYISRVAKVSARYPYHPECRTAKCAHRADMAWVRHQIVLRKAREAREARRRPRLSAHAECIIRKESGGDPHAVSGIYSGIAQWEQSRWESDGGLRYAPTPTRATLYQQEKVLMAEGDAGMSQQQGQYDSCG